MRFQPASTLQDRAGRVLFRVFLASLLLCALALILLITYFNGRDPHPGIAVVTLEFQTWMGPVLAAVFLTVLLAVGLAWYLSGILADMMITPLVQPLAQLEDKLRSLARDGSDPGVQNGIVIDTELQEVRSLAEATSELVERIRYLGMHDPLTGIYNRAYFEREMQRLAASGEETVGFIMGDLDNLKITNDTLGHKAGDFLLRNAAMILQSAVREDDILARIGGDEFVIIVQDCREEDLELIIDRINERIRAFNLGNGKVQLGISLGYAYGHPLEYDVADILKEADTQMYLDKGTAIQGVLPLHQQAARSGRRGSRRRDTLPDQRSEKDILDSLHLF